MVSAAAIVLGEEGTEAAEGVSARLHHLRETGEEVRGRRLEEAMVATADTGEVGEVDIDSMAHETIELAVFCNNNCENGRPNVTLSRT